MADAIFELSGVRKRFGETVITEVLKGIDLSVRNGELVALVGPSGSGKSTLLNLLGLLDVPSEGSLRLLGEETVGMRDARRTALRGRTLGFVFQFHHLLPSLTARENVVVPMAASSGRFTDAQRVRAAELLERVGLGDKVDARAGELSGGQQQRVAIARALAMRPRCVLADEPTGNLDRASAEQVFELLRETNAREGMACVLVTHDPGLAERCARVIELVDGRIVRDRASVRQATDARL